MFVDSSIMKPSVISSGSEFATENFWKKQTNKQIIKRRNLEICDD